MAKRETQNTDRNPTRKQIARSKREQRQLRMIYLGLGLVVALILIVLAFGLIQTYVLEPRAPVAIVDGVEISTAQYQDRVRYERYLLDEQLLQLQQQLTALAQPGNEQLAEFLQPQYEQLANQVAQQRQLVDTLTLDTMIEDQLVAREAAERNLTVAPEEVTEEINQFLARRAGGLTAAAAEATVTARAEASATAALWTPTPTFTPSPTLTATTEITGPTATPANTPTPAPTPTLSVIQEPELATQYTDWLNVLSEQVGIDEARYREIIQTSLLREKVQEAIGAEAPTEAEQARARHILVETEEEAQQVVGRLEAGEDFGELAQELSLDTFSGAEGGDLGFVTRGRFVEPVDEAVFSLPIGEISTPIQSDFGWHIVEVLEKEVRELSPADYSRSQTLAYQDWLTEARAAADIQNLWTLDKAPDERSLALPPQG